MHNALSIILSPTSLLLACAVGIVAIFVVFRIVVQRRGETEFCSLVDALTVKAHSAIQELEGLFVPTHLITDEDKQE